MKKLISILLVFMLICSMVIPTACAEIEFSSHASEYFSSYGTTLSNEGNSLIKIVFTVEGTEICDELGVATFSVQKYHEDTGIWEDVTGLVSGQTREDVLTYTFSKYFQGVEDEIYRVQVTFISVIDGEVETKAYTSGAIMAKRQAD